ncbi:MAG: hypothetical protein ACREOH_22395 [Candidatus Entotheonellia bacterium]
MAEWPFGGMRVRAAVDQEIRALMHTHGRMTFAQFMQACLYSPHGGFYAARGTRISTHFGTSPTSHPVFGALLARQWEHMWHLLGDPPVFHVLEVGSGDGALAQAIVQACGRMGEGGDEIAVGVLRQALQGHGTTGGIAEQVFQLVPAMRCCTEAASGRASSGALSTSGS